MAAQQFLCSVALYSAWLRCGANWVAKLPRNLVAMNGIIATSDSFSVGVIPRSIEPEPFKILDGLINSWCERRALRPLRYLLRAYPGVLAHTDQQFELLEALKKVKALCHDDLTPEERRLVTQAHDFFEERLRICVI
jgi:hypothetical protein